MLARTIWRLSEPDDRSLGLSCTPDDLFLGRTPLLDRRGNCFAARQTSDLGRLFTAAYGSNFSVEKRMAGLRAVAVALNEGQVALAAIAALHLRLPQLAGYRPATRLKPRIGK